MLVLYALFGGIRPPSSAIQNAGSPRGDPPATSNIGWRSRDCRSLLSSSSVGVTGPRRHASAQKPALSGKRRGKASQLTKVFSSGKKNGHATQPHLSADSEDCVEFLSMAETTD